MGKNLKAYISEAYRTLKIGGQLIVYHPARGNDRKMFISGLEANGFVTIKDGQIYKWHYIWAMKQAKIKNKDREIRF